jgi:hypothetical protein
METVSVIISFLSVFFAVWFGLKSLRLSRENAELQKRLLALQEKNERDRQRAASKAQLRAQIEDYGHHNYRLVIKNIGNCEARNVVLHMDGKPFDEHAVAVEGEGRISVIGAHSSVTRLLALSLSPDCSPPFDLDIAWEDASGDPGRYQTTLTF